MYLSLHNGTTESDNIQFHVLSLSHSGRSQIVLDCCSALIPDTESKVLQDSIDAQPEIEATAAAFSQRMGSTLTLEELLSVGLGLST